MNDNLTLAPLYKELKDAGFPGPSSYRSRARYGVYGDNDVYEIFLSELIEACGEDFYRLTRHVESDEFGNLVEVTWFATPGDDVIAKKKIALRFCPTPKEAVARLYLALHPK